MPKRKLAEVTERLRAAAWSAHCWMTDRDWELTPRIAFELAFTGLIGFEVGFILDLILQLR